MTLPPRKLDETDQQYLERLAAAGPLGGKGAIELTLAKPNGIGDLMFTRILVFPDGVVDTNDGLGRRLVFRLKPLPSEDETSFQLIERVAAACRMMAKA